jgi:tetratricopeptide (TPR) repeat protein
VVSLTLEIVVGEGLDVSAGSASCYNVVGRSPKNTNMNRIASIAIVLLAVVSTGQTTPATPSGQSSTTSGTRPAASSAAPNKDFLAAMDALKEGRLDVAEPVLIRLLKSAPENADYNLGMGTLLAMKGQTPSAIPLLEKSVKIKPSAQGYATLGAAYADVGRGDQAIASLRKSLSLDPANLGSNFNLAAIYIQLNSFAEAQPLLEKVVKARPTEPEPTYLLALCYSALNQPAQARTALLKLPVKVRETEQVLLLLSSNSAALGENGESRKYLERAHELNPISVPVMANLGALLVHEGERDRGLEMLEQAWKNDKTSYLAGMSLAQADYDAGKFEGALDVLGSLLTKGESPDIYTLLGNTEDALKNHDKAVMYLSRAAELDPSEHSQFAIGYSQLQAGKADLAENAFRAALEKLPLSARLRMGLGAAYLAENKSQQAVQTLQPFSTKDDKPDPLGVRLYELAQQSLAGTRDDVKIKQAIADLKPK